MLPIQPILINWIAINAQKWNFELVATVDRLSLYGGVRWLMFVYISEYSIERWSSQILLFVFLTSKMKRRNLYFWWFIFRLFWGGFLWELRLWVSFQSRISFESIDQSITLSSFSSRVHFDQTLLKQCFPSWLDFCVSVEVAWWMKARRVHFVPNFVGL